MSSILLDSFSGGAADLPRKKMGDKLVVLGAIRRDPKLSCFDRSEYPALERSVKALKEAGFIAEVPAAYPWFYFRLTDAGVAALEAAPT